MKNAASGVIAAAVAVVVASTASAQNTTTYQYQQFPSAQTQTQTYQNPAFQTQQGGSVTYGAPTTTYQAPQAQPQAQPQTQTYQSPGFQTQQGGSVTYGAPAPTYGGGTATFPAPQGFPVPQPYNPGAQPQTFPGYPAPPPPANPNPAPRRGEVADTDAWTFAVARYYPAIKACLRNTKVSNPVVANIQERRNATVMLIGQGGTAEYQVCRTGLNGTRVREGKSERGLPPAFYAPLQSSFTITPDRPFQPVVDTGQRLLGWIVRTTPVRLDTYGGGRTFDGQFIKPVTVNPDAQ